MSATPTRTAGRPGGRLPRPLGVDPVEVPHQSVQVERGIRVDGGLVMTSAVEPWGLAPIADIRILVRIPLPLDGSYDVVVPNKTIYVSDGDLPLYQRAQELAGGNLSAAISAALRRYVELEAGRREGFDEIIVRVGLGRGRKVRFTGVLLGEWVNTSASRIEAFHVYRGRSGKFVLHIERSADYSMVDAEGKPAGWRGYLGIGNISYGSSPGESTLEVIATLDELRERYPEAAL